MHTIAFVNPTIRFPAEPQLEALKKLKPNSIMNTKDGYTVADLLKITKRKSRVAVHGVGRLGATTREMREALVELHKNGVIVYDAKMDVELTAAALASYAKGVQEVNGEARFPGIEASLRGKKGVAAKRATKQWWKDDPEARELWFNRGIATDAEAAIRIGVSKRSLYEYFGKSGRKAGRRKP
jgi:hypothetical protein